LTTLTEANLEALLRVQALDTDLDRCRVRHASLPERAELAAIDSQLVALEQRLAAAQAERDVVADRQASLEHNLAVVESRAADIKKRLYGGTVSATRELQAMAAEVDSLTDRASELESRALEAMDEREPLDASVDNIVGEKSSLLAARATVGERLAVREAEVAAETDALNSARAQAAANVPEELVVAYDRLRLRLGGVGIARLVGSRCDGCHLTLAATEIDHLRHQPSGTLNYCEQCGRILVATHL
jgi:predicted  nucleic acid-binding Zn-ribbon protein